MRNNSPVTNSEMLLPESEFIYSRTDLKGVITEANEAFCKVSAYTRDKWSVSRTIWCVIRTCPRRLLPICGGI